MTLPVILLILAVILGSVSIALYALAMWKIASRHENHLLGLQYDVGLLAIALQDAGIPIRGDLRELAYHARQGLPECDTESAEDL